MDIACKFCNIDFNCFDPNFWKKKTNEINSGEMENSKKKRKNCDTNWAEAVVAIKYIFPDLNTKQMIIDNWSKFTESKKLKIKDSLLLEKYYQDILIRSDSEINQYLNNLNNPIINTNDILSVYLVGKSYKDFPELVELNQQFNIKRTKSDVYIKSNSNLFTGISVKAGKGCTMTNYSIEKILYNMGVDGNKILKKKRNKVLLDGLGCSKYSKEQREQANKLFYDKNNEYFIEIIRLLDEHNEQFTNTLLEEVFCALPYDYYLFNGIKYIDLNKTSNDIKGKEKKIIRYVEKESPKAAKLWYKVFIDNEPRWKFCIRGKNQLNSSSMQILEFTDL